jgi:hypothetical protein
MPLFVVILDLWSLFDHKSKIIGEGRGVGA